MTKVLVKQAKNIMNHREAVFFILAACFVLSLFSYAFSVRQAVINVVTREALIKEIHTKSTDVSELETEYFGLKNAVNIELAHKEGFKEAPVSMFISKKALGSVLTLGN
jgi:hypothetical protein